MEKKLLSSSELEKFFIERNYKCLNPFSVVNNNDTIFVTAGIQPILRETLNNNLNEKKIYISQPVLRTQFINSISEGSSLAFVNSTTSGINISEKQHNELVNDWLQLFYSIGMNKSNFSISTKNYERLWGELKVSGVKKFYYYNGLEIGDTTFFTNITKDGYNLNIDTLSDVGFGLERIRWCINKKSYFDLYTDSKLIPASVKAYLSAIALLCVNGVVPSNKSAGYRFRLFSKKLSLLLSGRELSEGENRYLYECIKYWKEWQKVNNNIDINTIENEYIRNCNRYILDELMKEGYENLSGININVSKNEIKRRILSSGVDIERVKKI